ncbi:MAG: acyl-CoA dehydrogenase family protein [Pseudomonadota bacterium]
MFHFSPVALDKECLGLRSDVRAFLQFERDTGGFRPVADCWVSGARPEFSRKLGQRGWLGMTWPKAYGGQDRPALHRYIVTEELLAAGAPVAAHWIADRQTGSQILKFGSEDQKQAILPKMAAGECFTAIGMSESQAGSDLAAVKTKAVKTANGWRLSGRKIWSTGAHLSDYMIVLARTSPAEGRNRQIGLSQFLVDLSLPGVDVSGIKDLGGQTHFNETLFEDVDLPDDALLGEEGNGWAQCMGELTLERSGPERFLTSFALLEQVFELLRRRADRQTMIEIGEMAAHLRVLRVMSLSIAEQMQSGQDPEAEAVAVKAMGNTLENQIVARVRDLIATVPDLIVPADLSELLQEAIWHVPSNTLRGGTTEILRGIIARKLGMR